MTRWLNRRELREATGLSDRTLFLRASEGRIKTRFSKLRAANGRPIREYDPSQLQQSDSAARSEELPTPKALTAKEEALAGELSAMLRPLVEWGRDGVKIAGYANADALAQAIANEHGMSKGKVWRLYGRFRDEGPAGLVRKRRGDSGASRFFGTPDLRGNEIVFSEHNRAAHYVLKKFKEGHNFSAIAAFVSRDWKDAQMRLANNGEKPPSYNTIKHFLETLPQPVRDSIRRGSRFVEERHMPHVARAIEQIRPNQVWISDHRIYDVFVQNDCFGRNPRREATRLWQTAIEDMRTRVIVGDCWALTPSSRTIASALRVAIESFGMPEVFYVDNGKDYRKIGKGALPPHELDDLGGVQFDDLRKGILANLGIRVQHCEPFRPQSKQIESYFATVSKNFDVIYHDAGAYAGRRSDLRSDRSREALKDHEQFLAGKRASSPLPLASDFLKQVRQWTHEFNERPHGGRGMNGRTPLQVMNELLPAPQRRLVDVAQIAPLFWDRQERMVQNSAIEIYGYRYDCGGDESLALKLFLLNGQRILVACDPSNVGKCAAWTSNGEWVGVLQAEKLLIHGAVKDEDLAGVKKLRAKIRRVSRNLVSALGDGVKSEYELLSERAGVEPTPRRLQLPPAIRGSAAVAPVYTEDAVEELRALMQEAVAPPRPQYIEDVVNELLLEEEK